MSAQRLQLLAGQKTERCPAASRDMSDRQHPASVTARDESPPPTIVRPTFRDCERDLAIASQTADSQTSPSAIPHDSPSSRDRL